MDLHEGIVNTLGRIEAPAFNLAAVAQRAERQTKNRQRPPRKRPLVLAALIIGVPCLAAAAVVAPSTAVRQAVIAQLERWGAAPLHHSVSFEKGTAVDVDSAKRTASFHLVMPVGLPRGSELTRLDASGSAGTSYMANYRLANGRLAWFSLERATAHARYAPWIGFVKSDDDGRIVRAVRYPAHVWLVGDEAVVAASNGLTAAQFAAIQRAMSGTNAPIHRGPIK